MSEAPTQGPGSTATEPKRGPQLAELMVTEEELAHLDFSDWKADKWLQDAVDLELRFGFESPERRAQRLARERAARLYRILEILLIVDLTLAAVMLVLQLGGAPAGGAWEQALRAASRGDDVRAVRLLEQHLAAPGCTGVERGLCCNQIALLLARAGRPAEARRYEREARAILERALSPKPREPSAPAEPAGEAAASAGDHGGAAAPPR